MIGRKQSRWRAAAATVIVLVLAGASAPGFADTRHHALSLIGDPKTPADFKHFDWVDPAAPKGGSIRLGVRGTFDTLYGYNIKGNKAAGIGGSISGGLIYQNLMSRSLDEPSAEYGQVAEWVSFPDDYASVTYGIRPTARFNDGKPVTPDDLIFSMFTLKRDDPMFAQYYKNVVKGEKTGEREVTFTFDGKGNRELPHIVGELIVLPKHYWEGKDASGAARDTTKSTLEPPLGSGPYRIKSFEPGRYIEFERVKDWWAKDLPVNVGQWNFDTVRYEYFRDQEAMFQEFKAGRLDFWRESSAKQWSTEYGFPAVKSGAVKKAGIPLKGLEQMTAFAMNLRRKQFSDQRVRRAFNLAYNFEEANKQLFYGLYTRVTNYFGEEGLSAKGLPTGRELEILDTVRNQVPPEVFTTEPKQPVSATPEQYRKNLGEAAKLLAAAGWTPKSGVLVNAKGEPLKAEFLLASPQFERIVQPYVNDLKRLGIQATLRTVDPSQYEVRVREFDYDIIVDSFPQSNSPGNEQRDWWGSASADIKGGRNTIGIKNPAIDKLIDRIIFSKDRADLEAATRALDRVLLANDYVVPHWYSPYDRIAYWDKFGRPKTLPTRAVAFQQVWWYDAAAAKALEGKRAQ